jgi:hypothetical protein
MKVQKILIMLLMIGFASLFTSCDKQTNKNEPQVKNETEHQTTKTGITKSEVELRDAMDRLWIDHVSWTRNVILNIMDGLAGTDDALKRLLKNQEDIGNAIKTYYGDEAGTKLTALLKTHIVQAGDLLKAAKSDNQDKFKSINEDWKKNADSIAVFLSRQNSANWPESDMKKMMQDHLSLTIDEATARLKKDYPGDVKAYDKVVDEILKMSDMLSAGIVKQYPEKFAK